MTNVDQQHRSSSAVRGITRGVRVMNVPRPTPPAAPPTPTPTVRPLTPRQIQTACAIRDYRHLHGVSPTFQELANTLGISKTGTIEHLHALVAKRVISFEKRNARTILIIDDSALPSSASRASLPLLGNIMGNSPIEAVENREDLDLAEIFHAKAGVYVLRVRGDSLADEHFCDGDHVVIERRDHARNGERVVVQMNDGTTTLKRYYKEGNRVRLQPANATMEPVLIDAGAMRILGVVIGMLRQYAM